MERYVYPKGKARREHDRQSKRRAALLAEELKADIKAKHISDAEILSELRLAGELATPSSATKGSGHRARKIARKRSRPPQVVTPKQGSERQQPLFTRTQYVMLGIDYRNFCHEAPTSYRRDNAGRRLHKIKAKSVGRNAPVQALEYTLKPAYPVGHKLYRQTKSVYDQTLPVKGHDPHARPVCVSLVRQDVLRLLSVGVSPEAPTRIVPHRYVGTGGVQHVKLFEIPVEEYRNPDAVTFDRTAGERTLSVHRAFLAASAETYEAYRQERIAKRKLRKAKCRARKAEENPEVIESDNAIVYSVKEHHAPLRKRFSPEGNGPTRRDGATKKDKRRHVASFRDAGRIIDFEQDRCIREEAGELGWRQLGALRSYQVAKRVAAFDERKAVFDAKPVDPVKAGKKAAKLAAFKERQVLVTEARLLKKQQREERRVRREEQVAYEKTW